MASLTNFATYFRSLKILHFAFQLAPLLFLATIHFVLLDSNSSNKELGETFRYLIPGLAIAAIFAGRFVANNRLQAIKSEADLDKKLEEYRSVSMIRWALIEGVTLFAVVAYFLTGLSTLALVALALSAYFFTLRPTPELLITELELDHQDRSAILGR